MPKYFMMLNGVRVGPYEREELVQAGISRSTLVWTDGMPGWSQADVVPEFAGMLSLIPPEVAASAPTPPPTPTAAMSAPPAPRSEADVMAAVRGAVVRTANPFPLALHVGHLVFAGLCAIVGNAISRHGLAPWWFLVPAPFMGLIGLVVGKRSIAFWWGYWLGPIGWIVAFGERGRRFEPTADTSSLAVRHPSVTEPSASAAPPLDSSSSGEVGLQFAQLDFSSGSPAVRSARRARRGTAQRTTQPSLFATCWSRFVGHGRARRREYWLCLLGNWVATLACLAAIGVLGARGGCPESVAVLAACIVLLTSAQAAWGNAVRRMHDSGRSAWWALCPVLNVVYLFADSQRGENQYGQDPKQRER